MVGVASESAPSAIPSTAGEPLRGLRRLLPVSIFLEKQLQLFFHEFFGHGQYVQVQDDQPGRGWHLRLGLPGVQPREQGEGGCKAFSIILIL